MTWPMQMIGRKDGQSALNDNSLKNIIKEWSSNIDLKNKYKNSLSYIDELLSNKSLIFEEKNNDQSNILIQ